MSKAIHQTDETGGGDMSANVARVATTSPKLTGFRNNASLALDLDVRHEVFYCAATKPGSRRRVVRRPSGTVPGTPQEAVAIGRDTAR